MKFRMIAMEATGSAEALGQLVAGILGGPPPSDLRTAAAAHLKARGRHVEPAPGPIPGLWLVDGREVTEGQLLDMARQA